MSFRVHVSVEEFDGLDGELLSETDVSRLIKEDSWGDNAEEWAAIMDSTVSLVYGARLPFKIAVVDIEE